ncbi:MAG: ATPase domain-containing protein [Candidatus Atabeyarchaeum deiterrae]
MSSERAPTGIDGLDEMIEGGFQKGSLIILAGNPGTGKTVFATSFLCKGANLGETGVYASFAENKETFTNNMSKHLNRDCEICSRKEKCQFLDLVTSKEGGTPTLLQSIQVMAEETKASRLVIDSFTAMTQAFRDKIDARVIVHTILRKIVRHLRCTTILVVEIPTGQDQIGVGVEEFVADTVVKLSVDQFEGHPFRELELRKVRGTRIPERKLVFTLEGGFKAFAPFKTKDVEEPRRFTPIADQDGRFSTGSADLDTLLGGGYPKGSSVLLEIDERISAKQSYMILNPTVFNFWANGRAELVIASAGVDQNTIKKQALNDGFSQEEIGHLFKIWNITPKGYSDDRVATPFGETSVVDEYGEYHRIEEELMRNTGKPVLRITGGDSLIAFYGADTSARIWNLDAIRLRERGNLGILVLRPASEDLSKTLSAVADVHLRLMRRNGALILRGIKPRTGLHVVELDTSKGYPLPKLTPIV